LTIMNRKITARLVVVASVVATALAAGGASPAQAALLPHCQGSNIHGEGTNVQTAAQGVCTTVARTYGGVRCRQ
jgi:hypothetical protein